MGGTRADLLRQRGHVMVALSRNLASATACLDATFRSIPQVAWALISCRSLVRENRVWGLIAWVNKGGDPSVLLRSNHLDVNPPPSGR